MAALGTRRTRSTARFSLPVVAPPLRPLLPRRCGPVHSGPLVRPQAYELSVMTGAEVLVIVASEKGNVFTFASEKLQPMTQLPESKNLICVSRTRVCVCVYIT